MSTAYAIGAVTAVLRNRMSTYLTASGVSSSVGGVNVTASAPDRVAVGAQEKNAVNVFCHRVTRNQGWANAMEPSRNAAGDAVAAQPFGATLHYVISAYGPDLYAPEILLGHAIAALHEEPVLTRGAIRKTLAPNPPDPTLPVGVAQSRLADQIEQLRVSFVNPSPEEVSRMWATFTSPYRPSSFVDINVVLIEPRRGFASALPVAAVGVGAIGAAQPTIDAVVATSGSSEPVVAGSTLLVTGSGLAGPGLLVHAGGATADAATTRDTELTVPVAAFSPPLQSGLLGVWVTHTVPLGDPPVGHQVVTSESIPVALRPTISFTPNAVTTTSTSTVEGVPVATGTAKVAVAPDVGRSQQVVLLLSEVGAPATRPPRDFSLPAPADNGVPANASATSEITFAYTMLPRGPYVARLRVDGIDSPVAFGAGGTYDEPKLTVP